MLHVFQIYRNSYFKTCSNGLLFSIALGVVTTLAGGSGSGYVDGVGMAAYFASPEGVAVDSNGNIFVADYGNNRIRKCTGKCSYQ